MPEPDLIKKLSELSPVLTAHGTGQKFVFRSNDQMSNASTQIAFGQFEPGEVCEEHVHSTMYEYFFFLEGKGTYLIDNVSYDLEEMCFLEIPPKKRHSLHADKGETLKFVYWGIATD